MTESCVCNASPLIALGQVGRLDLFDNLAPLIRVPDTVLSELEPGNLEHHAADAVRSSPLFLVVPSVPLEAVVQRWNLDPGESQVLSVAVREPRAGVLIDDLAARRCATFLGLTLMGTVGLVARARRQGQIAAAAPILDALREAGLFVAPRLRQVVLERLGEIP